MISKQKKLKEENVSSPTDSNSQTLDWEAIVYSTAPQRHKLKHCETYLL